MRPLHEIRSDYADIMRAMIEATEDDGEVPPQIAEQFDAVALELNEKLDNCYRVLRTLEADAEAAFDEADRVLQIAHQRQKRVDWMKRYILESMQATGLQKHESAICKMRIQKNSRPSIRMFDGEEIPPQYQRVKIEFDGTTAYEDWKNGVVLPPTIIVDQGYHLRTK